METVKNRRSIRKYAGKPVDEELLRRLFGGVGKDTDHGEHAALQRGGDA